MYRPAGYSDEEDDDYDEWMYESNYYYDHRLNNADLTPARETDGSNFYRAITEGNIEKVKTLITAGFPIDELLSGGWTGLMHACALGSINAVQYLLEAKADVNFNKEKFTPIMALCKSNSNNGDELVECLNALVQNGADIDATDNHACTALMYACSSIQFTLIKALIALDCDVNIQNLEGWSALFHAVQVGREDIVRVLIEGKARLDLIDKRGRSAYDLAMQKGFEELAQLVCSNKKKQNLINEEEDLPYSESALSDPIQELIQELPSSKCKYMSVYSKDVNKLLWAMGMKHLTKQIMKNSVQLNQFLLITDEQLKQFSVRFSIHRQTILNSIRKFHLHQWNKASLGMKPRNQQMNLEDGVKLLCNVTKHLYILTATINYVRIHQTLPVQSDIFVMSEHTLHQLKLISSDLNSIGCFASRLKNKERVEPVDLIKPKGHNTHYFFPLVTTVILVCIMTWKFNIPRNFVLNN